MRVTMLAVVGMHDPGHVVDLPDERAEEYIRQGLAEPAPERQDSPESDTETPAPPARRKPGPKPGPKGQTKVMTEAPENKAEAEDG